MSSEFGKRLTFLRKETTMTQEDLGKLFNVHKGTISKWESGSRTPDIDIIVKIANYFNVTTDFLLGLSDERKPSAKTIYTGKELSDLVPSEWREAIEEIEYLEFYQKMKKDEINPDDLIEFYKAYKKFEEKTNNENS